MQGERGMMDTMRPLAKLMSMSCLGWQRNNRSSTSVAFKNNNFAEYSATNAGSDRYVDGTAEG